MWCTHMEEGFFEVFVNGICYDVIHNAGYNVMWSYVWRHLQKIYVCLTSAATFKTVTRPWIEMEISSK